jgi:hypothetical protein
LNRLPRRATERFADYVGYIRGHYVSPIRSFGGFLPGEAGGKLAQSKLHACITAATNFAPNPRK